MRIVIDTSVWVRYLLRPNAGTRTLIEDQWLGGSATLVTSPELLAELDSVLQRPKISRFITAEEAAQFMETVRANSLLLPALAAIPPFTRDRKDDKFIACGLAGAATYVITYDEDLLVLGAVENLQIATPEEYLNRLSSPLR